MTNEIAQSFAVIIIGGGPAGISAAMGFLEARIDCLLIDRGAALGGQVWDIPSDIVNLPGSQFKNGKDLAEALQSALDRALELAVPWDGDQPKTWLRVQRDCPVLKITAGDDAVLVSTDSQTYQADYLLVATGYRVKSLPAPQGDQFKKHWHNNTDNLPQDLSELSLAVVGGGDSALLKVLGLGQRAKEIHMIVRGKSLKGRPDLVAQLKNLKNLQIHTACEIVGLLGDQSLERVVLLDKESGTRKEIEVAEVLIKVGYEPNTELLQNIVNLDDSRHVVTNAAWATSHPRIYAIGDIVNQRHPRIASAIGQGMLASGAIIEKVFSGPR